MKNLLNLLFASSLMYSQNSLHTTSKLVSEIGNYCMTKNTAKSNKKVFGPRVWPNKMVFYNFNNLDERIKEASLNAFKEIERATGIRFIKRTIQANYIDITQHDLFWARSAIGMMGGKQNQVISTRYGDLMLHYLCLHETLHALGLYHEHQRPDRDKYIIVEKTGGAFDKIDNITMYEPYDFESVMNYFGLKARPEFYPIQVLPSYNLTQKDINRIKSIYNGRVVINKNIEEPDTLIKTLNKFGLQWGNVPFSTQMTLEISNQSNFENIILKKTERITSYDRVFPRYDSLRLNLIDIDKINIGVKKYYYRLRINGKYSNKNYFYYSDQKMIVNILGLPKQIFLNRKKDKFELDLSKVFIDADNIINYNYSLSDVNNYSINVGNQILTIKTKDAWDANTTLSLVAKNRFEIIKEEILIKRNYKQNYHATFHVFPNPFNPKTTFIYELHKIERVNISIYNLAGQLVKVLENMTKEQGRYEISWNGTNQSDIKVSSGVYFLKFKTNSKYNKVYKLILLK